MSSTPTTPAVGHAIAAFTLRLRNALARVGSAPAWSMTTAEQATVLVELSHARAGLDELMLRVLAAADRDDIAALSAATSTTAWLAHAIVQAPGAAHADVKLAQALDEQYDATRTALAQGAVDLDQARVIVRAVDALPPDAVEAEPGLPRRAEAHLLDLARTHDAKKLRHLARHLHAVLDPDGADERLGRALEAEEERAARRTMLELRDNGDGTHTATARIPTLHAAMLRTMLEAILNPRRHATGDTLAASASGAAAAGAGTASGLDRAQAGRVLAPRRRCRVPSSSVTRSAGSWNGSPPTRSPSPVASQRP